MARRKYSFFFSTPEKHDFMTASWIEVYSCSMPHLAEILIAVLMENNIHAVSVKNQDSAYPTIGDYKVMVNPSDAILARVVVEQFEAQ